MSKNLRKLTDTFRKLGAVDPEGWASSQINEGIPQLERFVFLKQAWLNIISDDDPSWIDERINGYETNPNAPYGGVGRALKSLRGKGATNEELTELVRGMQASFLFDLCYTLENPGDFDGAPDDVLWGLYKLNDDFEPIEPIQGLHEDVLEADPTGREVRPRPES